jgi:phosphonate transport system substrate-binding protein
MHIKPHTLIATTLLVLSLVTTGSHAAAPADPDRPVITFGVVPQQAASRLARLWMPVLDYLSEHSGHTLRFKTAPDIPAFEAACARGEYDMAYMNPYHYTVFRKVPGYRAFAKEKDKQIRGIIVVRKDSPLAELSELSGKTLAFPSPLAFAASMLPRASLKEQGIDITPRYVSSHDSVYRAVAKELFEAGGGVLRTFRNTDPEVREQLRILWTTDSYTPHAIAVHPRIDAEVTRQIEEAMLAMDEDPRGAALLHELRFTGIEMALDQEWDEIDALQMETLGLAGK